MKVVMIMVSSLNGKTTNGADSDIYKWTSSEDSDFFFSKIKEAKVIIMGSGTYEVIREKIKNDPGRLRIVLTKSPEKYSSNSKINILEFSSSEPNEILSELSYRGYEEILLVGGAGVNKSFIESGLVNEIFLTIEPVIFGSGKNLMTDGNYFKDLNLVEVKKLNDKGSLLLKYKVENK